MIATFSHILDSGLQHLSVLFQMESVPYIFSQDMVKKLMTNKFVVFIGGSGE